MYSITTYIKVLEIQRTFLQNLFGGQRNDIYYLNPQLYKENVSIPVIGNGDVFTAKDAEEMLKHCDYAMIARGAIRNPMIFKEILHYFKTGETLKIKPEDKIDMFFDYHKLTKKYPYGGIVILRKRAQDFTHGLINSTKIRNKITYVKTEEELLDLMEKYKKSLV